MDAMKTTDASGGGESKRPWQPWERSYSGNRVGVRQDGDWTILHILSGGAETTTSIREHEAWDLAGRVSPKLLTALQEAGAENRRMRDALHELSAVCAAGNAEQLREAAEEIYCGDDCKHHFYDGSCNSHECSLEGTGECGWHRSESLKSLAEALETHAALASAPPAPTPDAGASPSITEAASKWTLSQETLEHLAEIDRATIVALTGFAPYTPITVGTGTVATDRSPLPAEDLAGQGEPVAWAYDSVVGSSRMLQVTIEQPEETPHRRNIRPLYEAAPRPAGLTQSHYELLRECQAEFKALGCKGLVETIEAQCQQHLAQGGSDGR